MVNIVVIYTVQQKQKSRAIALFKACIILP